MCVCVCVCVMHAVHVALKCYLCEFLFCKCQNITFVKPVSAFKSCPRPCQPVHQEQSMCMTGGTQVQADRSSSSHGAKSFMIESLFWHNVWILSNNLPSPSSPPSLVKQFLSCLMKAQCYSGSEELRLHGSQTYSTHRQ